MALMDQIFDSVEFKQDSLKNKVRILIIDRMRNKILLCSYKGIFLLPGGSVNKDEKLDAAIIRETYEETGISLKKENLWLVSISESRIREYITREDGLEYRMMISTWFATAIYDKPKTVEKNLTESEKKNNFRTMWVSPKMALFMVKTNFTRNPRNYTYKRELVAFLGDYLQTVKAFKSRKKSNTVYKKY